MIRSLCLVVVVAFPLAASAGWQYAEWGMSSADLVKASSGKARAISGGMAGGKTCVVKAVAAHAANDLDFDVRFCFSRSDDRLESVQLELRDPDAKRAMAVFGELDRRYGKPEDHSDAGEIEVAHWRDAKHGNLVTFGRIGSLGAAAQKTSVTVEYRELPTAGSGH